MVEGVEGVFVLGGGERETGVAAGVRLIYL